MNVVTGHAVYSSSAPVAVTEAWRRVDATRPWLGALGIAVAAAAYLGAAALIINEPDSESATPVRMTRALATAMACTAAAWVGRRGDPGGLALRGRPVLRVPSTA